MKYVVIGGTAHVGTDMVLGLSKEQAEARAPALEKVSNGYRPKDLVQFKEGEEIELAVPQEKLPRNLAVVLRPLKQGESGKKLAADARRSRSAKAAKAKAERAAKK